MSKCHFGVKQVDFLGQTITPQGVSPQVDEVEDVLAKLKIPKFKKGFQRYIGFLYHYRNYLPRLSERLTPFFKLLKETNKFHISNERIFSNLLRILRIWTLNVGKYFSRNCFHRQSSSHEILPNKNNSSCTVERMRLRLAV